ncbi:MAG: hypothetical protein QM767_08660 [Anaeromyxobacter sp.]
MSAPVSFWSSSAPSSRRSTGDHRPGASTSSSFLPVASSYR